MFFLLELLDRNFLFWVLSVKHVSHTLMSSSHYQYYENTKIYGIFSDVIYDDYKSWL